MRRLLQVIIIGAVVAAGAVAPTTGSASIADLGTYRAVVAPVPADAVATGSGACLASVDCSAAGACVTVGSYTPASQIPVASVLTLQSGAWTARALPTTPGSSRQYFDRVSCTTAGFCAAFGQAQFGSVRGLGGRPPYRWRVVIDAGATARRGQS